MMFDLPEQKYQAKKFSVFGIVGEGWLVIGYAALLIFVACGCSSTASVSPEIKEQASGLTAFAKVEAKQDKTIESIEATRSEIVSQNRQIIDTLKTLEASLAKSKPQNGKDGDPSSVPPKSPAKADTQTPVKAATPGTSQSETLVELATRLYSQGVNTHMKTREQLEAIDAQLNGGQPVTGAIFQNNRASAITSQRSVIRPIPRGKSVVRWQRNTSQQTCGPNGCY